MKTKIKVVFKRLLVSFITLTMLMVPQAWTALAATGTVAILESSGWLEAASVKWSPYLGASQYNVYYKAANEADSLYKKIDGSLIRQYASYYRADILGLSSGSYTVKIVPVVSGSEVSAAQTVTQNITVKAHTREGFAFSTNSPMKTGSGGYNDNGTVPSNAQILYITPTTANSIKLDVITSSNGTKTTCTGIADILAKRQKGYDKTPLIIRMIGQVKAANINGLNSNGYLELKGCYNVTFEGVGDDATAYEWGFLIRDAHNVELRNVGVMLFPDDAISLDSNNENIWVHNNDIFYGKPGSDSDQVKGDGSTDIKNNSTYVTISYNHYWDSGKVSLCGMSEGNEFFVTYHHNWFDHSDSRHPRIRVGTIHIYNNYYDGNSKYGVGVTMGSSAFVEANYFRHVKYPMLSSLQGTDIYYGTSNATFSGEAGGMIKAFNNIVEDATRLVYAQTDNVQFDAYIAAARNEQVPATFKTVSGGSTYNNFDTGSSMYSYTPDSPDNVKSVVTAYAGRMNGGDFKWTFTAEDDTNYDVNNALKTAIQNYTSGLIEGTGTSKTIVSVAAPSAVTVQQGATAVLPATVTASYDDGSSGQAAVTWAAVDTSVTGTKTVHGTIAGYAAGVDIQVQVNAADPGNPTSGVIFSDNFTDATASNFFTAAYKALPNNSTKPMYVKTGGTVTIVANSVTLAGARFTIGASNSTGTTSTSTPGGVFDLSKAYKITIVTGSASGTGNFQVYVDNNTTSSGSSPLGSASKVYQAVGGSVANSTLTITPTVGTATSFLQIRTESSTNVEIKSIKIEYLQTVTISSITTPAAVTVEQGSTPSLPAAVTAAYSDGSSGQVPVIWAAVDTAIPGTKTVHGTIEGYAAGVDIQVTVTAPTITINSVQIPDSVTVEQGNAPVLPAAITAAYSDGSNGQVPVTWAAVDTSIPGIKTVHGTIEGYAAGVDIQVTVTAAEIKDETPPYVTLKAEDTYIKGQNYAVEVTSNEPGTITIEINNSVVVSDAAVQKNDTVYNYVYSIDTTDLSSLTVFATVKDLSGNTATVYNYAEGKAPAPIITSINPVPAVTVEQGKTPGLPAAVTAHYSDGSTSPVTVVWAAADTTVPGTFTVHGTVAGYEAGVDVQIIVTAPKTISSVYAPDPVTVEQGKAPGLPAAVTARYSDGGTSQVAVVWAAADTSVPGTITVHGTIEGYAAGVDIQVIVTPSTPSGNVILSDDFANATASNFFTAAYKALPSDLTKPMYIKNNGSISAAANLVTLPGSSRLSIGALNSTSTTSTSTPGGVFDLTKPYKITVVTGAASGTGKFQVYVDNNTTGSANSPLGSVSRVSDVVAGNYANSTITIQPSVGTAASFICLRTESSASIEIKSIKIEYIETQPIISSVIVPSPIIVTQGTAPMLPTTVNAVYSDGSQKAVLVNWESADTSTAGTKTVHGTIVGYAAGVDILVNVVPVQQPEDSAISPSAAVFDKNSSKQTDIAVAVTPKGNTLKEIKNGAAALLNGTDYTVSGAVYLIKKEYLSKLAVGTVTLTFDFSAGAASELTLAVIDTTAPVKSSDTALSSIVISQGVLTPVFSSNVLNYTVDVSHGISSVNITPIASSPMYSSLKINGNPVTSGSTYTGSLSVGDNIFNIAVTAEDGTSSLTYTITIDRASSSKKSGTNSGAAKDDTSTASSGTVPTAPEKTTEPTVDTKTGEAKLTLDSKTISDAFAQDQKDQNGTKIIAFEIPKTDGAKTYTAVLPASYLTTTDAAQKIELKSGIGSLEVPCNMLSNIDTKADEIEVSIGIVDPVGLPEAIKAKIGNRPIFDLSVSADGKKISYNNPQAPVKVKIPYTPTAEELKHPEHIVVWYIDGAGNVIPVPDGRYDTASKCVVFTTTHFSQYVIAYAFKTFDDIVPFDWAKNAIEVMASKGIITGTSDTEFTPESNITRADFLVLLVKTLGLNADAKTNFSDVKPTDYYYQAVGIAKALGLAQGEGDNRFNPSDEVTRQDMMVITARAMRLAGKLSSSNSSTDLSAFNDNSLVAGYAAGDITAMNKEGLIKGDNGIINPLGKATRAEAAVLLFRIYSK